MNNVTVHENGETESERRRARAGKMFARRENAEHRRKITVAYQSKKLNLGSQLDFGRT